MANHQQHPVTLRISRPGGSVDLPAVAANGFETTDRDALDVVADAIAVCAAFDVPGTTAVAVEDFERQREHIRFLAQVLKAGVGPLTGPYRDVVGTGQIFGATTESGLHLLDRSLACFVGVYGPVTACQEVPGIGALITVAEGTIVMEKVVFTEVDGEERLDAARTTILGRLQALGCTAISNHCDIRTRGRGEGT